MGMCGSGGDSGGHVVCMTFPTSKTCLNAFQLVGSESNHAAVENGPLIIILDVMLCSYRLDYYQCYFFHNKQEILSL